MERDIPHRDTPGTFLFSDFNSKYFNFISNNAISFQMIIYCSFQKILCRSFVLSFLNDDFKICCYLFSSWFLFFCFCFFIKKQNKNMSVVLIVFCCRFLIFSVFVSVIFLNLSDLFCFCLTFFCWFFLDFLL